MQVLYSIRNREIISSKTNIKLFEDFLARISGSYVATFSTAIISAILGEVHQLGA